MHANLVATYRLQLAADFGFRNAAATVDYLARLGISHVYLSPVLQAASGSLHGYDAIDPGRVSGELGGPEGLLQLLAALREKGMGAVIDIVPNHLSATAENPWWWDLLKRGAASPFARAFDVDWQPADPEHQGKVLVPVLGDHLGQILKRGEIVCGTKDAEPVLRYQNHMFPINDVGLDFMKKNRPEVSRILELQSYVLCHWRVATEEINYRRFFNIDTLAGIRIEEEGVFDAAHKVWLQLAAEGPVDGLRVDHPDGLRDPLEYLMRLRARQPDSWLIVEKILEPGEELRREWPVDGTTGYDFIQRCGGLFIDPSGERGLTDLYENFTGIRRSFPEMVREKKHEVLRDSFSCDLRRLVECFRKICRNPAVRADFTRNAIRRTLSEVIAGLPVYRTYFRPDRREAHDADRHALEVSLAGVRHRLPAADLGIIDLMEDVIIGGPISGSDVDDFIARLQQITGPVMAKGVEDTAFFCYNRLIALNEVGCDPGRFGVSPAAFHEASVAAQEKWPKAMLSSSTHDTKRGEDVRARICLLSEMPDEWAATVRRWSEHNQPAWGGCDPDRNAEYYLYQTIVGAWPMETERLLSHMKKACKEAGVHTSWIDPNEEYHHMIDGFVDKVLADPAFLEMLREFVEKVAAPGRVNSLAQTLLKLTAPGVPDIYQGCEIWDNSLTDPDNRRPVDFRSRSSMLEVATRHQMGDEESGAIKLWLIRTTLELRRRIPDAFGSGSAGRYTPLAGSGEKLGHVVAFRRGDRVAVVVPRLVMGLACGWGETAVDLGEGQWRNLLGRGEFGGKCMLARLLEDFPVALLERIEHR